MWQTADRLARAAGLVEYGILVVRASADEFLVLAEAADVEREFTQSQCR